MGMERLLNGDCLAPVGWMVDHPARFSGGRPTRSSSTSSVQRPPDTSRAPRPRSRTLEPWSAERTSTTGRLHVRHRGRWSGWSETSAVGATGPGHWAPSWTSGHSQGLPARLLVHSGMWGQGKGGQRRRRPLRAGAALASGDSQGRAKVFADNEASIRVLTKNGFELEGTERAAVLGRDGSWRTTAPRPGGLS